ncbi:lysine histidine transporter 1 [Prunus dulcis]|uniref:Lysine histidine transporter 1 n=1 Tax=Prunus dulcis TaxID=3755 RepID=A0A4Y1R8Q8_PRUDU|nr:lysine histidine transporter 1 [Prunus dulcis]
MGIDERPEKQSQIDEQLKRQKEIDDWLPITSSRNAKWWYSAFHNVTAMVGAGVLSLPYAMSNLGWYQCLGRGNLNTGPQVQEGPGTVILVLSWVITLFTLWQMVEMHEMVPGKRFDRYHELGQHAFGEKLGLWIVVPQQLICEVGVDIVYMVTGGKSLQKIHKIARKDKDPIKLTYFIMIFASAHFVLAHLPNFNSISGVSLAAAVMSLSYSTIAWTASVHKGVQPDVEYGYLAHSTSGTVFNFFTALGDVAFAYAGHNVVLEIQATIPSSPEKPSKKPMWRGVVIAYIVVALCYFPVAFIGYYIFGNKVEDNILISLEKPEWLIITANMFVVIHVIGSYQLYAMPVFDMIETLLVKKLHFRPTTMLRFISRNTYVDLHYTGCSADDPITYWRVKEYHTSSQDLQILQLVYKLGTCTSRDSKRQIDEQLEKQSQIDEQLKRQKEIDDWLPITSSRNAKYSAFHNVNAMVGAGVLSLPFAMGPGIVILVLSWVVTLFTLWHMVEMHEMVPGKRFDRYHELGQHAFGEKLGLWIVVPQQLICEVGVDIVYMVTGGKSLQKIHIIARKDKDPIKLTYFIMIFASAQFVLSHLPNFNSISGISLAAAVMSLSYSTIACTASVHKGVQPGVEYGYLAQSTSGTAFNFFTALGDIAFAYSGHNVVLEIQAIIPSSPEKPSKKPMWRGVVIAYIVVALCYFPVAFIGYYTFGNKVDDNILISLEKPEWLIITANMFVVIHVIGGYQLFAMPVFDMIESLLVKKLHFRPTTRLRFITRNTYVDLHYIGCSADDPITHWRVKEYHT